MSGILRGSIEHHFVQSAGYVSRDCFAATVNFFDSHPQMTRLASFKGFGSGGGQFQAFGTVNANTIKGYSGDAAYSGEGGWGLWRWNRVGVDAAVLYILVQWGSTSQGFGAPGALPGVLQGTYGVGIQIALDTSGTSPWTGTLNNNGADTKGTVPGVGPCWAPNGGTLLVFPRANAVSGTYVTNKQAFANIAYENGPNAHYSILADDDSIWAICDNGLVGGQRSVFWFGPYVARTGITPTANAAFAMFAGYNVQATDPPLGTADMGSTSNATTWEGGASVLAADDVRSFRFTSVIVTGTDYQPNPYVSAYDVLDAFLYMDDSVGVPKFGLFGKVDPANWAFVGNIANNDANAALTKVAYGSTNTVHRKFLFPWDGVTTPNSGLTQAGIQF